MKKVFKLEELGIMSGDILVLKAFPDSKIILSPRAVEELVTKDNDGFVVAKVGAGVNQWDWIKVNGEEDYPNFKEGATVFIENLVGLRGFQVEDKEDKKYFGLLIQPNNIKFYLK